MSVNECEYTVIDSSSGDNGFLDEARRNNPGAISVDSLEDMVDKLIAAATRNNCCIKKLKIMGHGWAGGIVVGNGQNSNDAAKRIDLSKAEWEGQLNRLKAKLCRPATIELFGCHTGAGDDGAKKIREIADVTGATVIGHTGEVFGDGREEAGTGKNKAKPKKSLKPTPAPPAGKKSHKTGKKMSSRMRNFIDGHPDALLFASGMFPNPRSGNSVSRRLWIKEARAISLLLRQIARTTVTLRNVATAIDGRLYAVNAKNGALRDHLIVVDDYRFVGIEGQWESLSPTTEIGREWLRSLAQAHIASTKNDQ